MLAIHTMGAHYTIFDINTNYVCKILYPSGRVCSDSYLPDMDTPLPDNWSRFNE